MKRSADVAGTVRSGGLPGSCLLVLCAVLIGGLMVTVLAEDVAPKDLRLFYQKNCVGCHGLDGAARDASGGKLNGQDFTDERWRKESDAGMVKVILGGKFFGWAMPAYKSQLTKDEAQRLVSEVLRKALKGKAIGP